MTLKELILEAQKEGFKPHTISTIWTMNCELGIKEPAFVNENCKMLLLTEIQSWLRDQYGVNIIIRPCWSSYEISEFLQYDKNSNCNVDLPEFDLCHLEFGSYEEALERGVGHLLRLIKEWFVV